MDQQDFVDRLSGLIPETQTRCYAWVLMTNHAHFLFRSGPTGISTLMRRLLTRYAVSFNRRHRRFGQLFQNRYKSIICQEDAYLKELVRYIHLNPFRAKMAEDLNALRRYAFCGHGVILGNHKQAWQDDAYVLKYFGDDRNFARERYLRYVESGLGH
jgi:REP element-mobilizing transposase RayT